jgi:small subunit ribosomal protein S2
MCSTKLDNYKKETTLLEKNPINKLPYNKKTFLIDQFFSYKALIGNKLRFTNPDSYEYIFGLNFTGNAIFNFNKSLVLLKRALTFIQQIKKNEGNILFVGTRHDMRKVIQSIGEKTNSPYINYKWLKGLLTNWENTSSSIRFYNLFLKKLDMRTKRRLKMKRTFFGLTTMNRIPDAIFIMDPSTDLDALKEARALNIPVIALVDTNVPTRFIDYPIPSNSESILSIIFFANLIISSLTKKVK